MAHDNLEILTGTLVDAETSLSLDQLCRLCGADTAVIVELVEEGILPASGAAPPTWAFEGAALSRARRALRLHRDLQINLAGVALALDLMDELDLLRRRLREAR